MKIAIGPVGIALLASLSPALAATHHRISDRGYPARAPVRITIHPARIDFDRYIDPVSGMYCRNTGWAAVCVPPGPYGADCRPAWPFPVCRSF